LEIKQPVARGDCASFDFHPTLAGVLGARPCTCTLRIHTTGLPADRYRIKKVYPRGLSWPPSGPLSPGDALDAGRADARRRLRPASLAASHHHGWLTPPLVVATAAPERAAPHVASRHGPSIPPPWPAFRAATVWPSRCRWWARAAAGAGVSSRGASRNCSNNGTGRAAAATPPHPCTAWRRAAPPRPHVGGW
jgi:hypothetical protein